MDRFRLIVRRFLDATPVFDETRYARISLRELGQARRLKELGLMLSELLESLDGVCVDGNLLARIGFEGDIRGKPKEPIGVDGRYDERKP